MSATASFVQGAPPDLVHALSRHNAAIVFSWREGLRAFAHAQSPERRLFIRYSDDPADRNNYEYDAAVRTSVGHDRALRVPSVLESGPGWMIEHGVRAEPWDGGVAVDAAIAAAADLPTLCLPERPARGNVSRFAILRRIAQGAAGPIGLHELRAAQRELSSTALPTVACHRDFHPKNILVEDGVAWVIDWERAAPGPLGLDLMRLWTSLGDPDDRARVFEHAVDLTGAAHRPALERLRHAVAVAEANGLHAARNPFDRDDRTLARLIALLPELRPSPRRPAAAT